MARVENEAQERKKLRHKQKQSASGNNQAVKSGRRMKLISLRVPKSAVAGETVTVVVRHDLKASLKEQVVHVTLKDGKRKRIARKVVKASGKGELEVEFEVPANVPGGKLGFAAFVGEDYQKNLQHVTAGPVTVK